MPTLTHRYQPRGSARTLLASRDPEILVSGPAGTGKSRACLEKVHAMCLANPGMRALVARKAATSLTSTALVTWKNHVAGEAIAAGQVWWYGGSSQEPAQYRYRNGSSVAVGGLDKSVKIMSSEYDLIYVQEATELTETDWEALTTRLRNGRVSFQQLIADANPDTPTHWLKRRCDRGAAMMLNSVHEENPVLFGEDGTITESGTAYMAKLDNLTGVRHLRLRKGLWVAAEGLIYDTWNPALNLIDKFNPPQDWTRYWSVDFGHTNPFVCQFWAEDPDGRLYLYREIYATGKLVEDHARDIMRLVSSPIDGYVRKEDTLAYEGRRWREPKPRTIICDHDAEDRATLERHLGLSTTAATKTVSDGIEAVMARMRPSGNGKARLMLMRDALVKLDQSLDDAKKPTCTEEEIPGYVWMPEQPGRASKDQPLKVNDHGCDAMRYMVAEVDLGVRPRVRFM